MEPHLPPQVTQYVAELESKDSGALVAVFDRNGYYLYATPNHQQAVGYAPGELLGMNLAQVVDRSEHHAAWVLRTISVLYTKPIHFSSRLAAKSGELIPISGTLRHIHDPHSDRYFVTCVNVVPR